MQTNNVYSHLSYVEFLKSAVKSNTQVYGYKARLAEAAKCQRSHLSLVLRKGGHFTPEQALGAAEFLGLEWAEKSYFLLLVQYARAGTQELKTFIKAQMDEQIQTQENLSQRIKEKATLPHTTAAVFYSNWEFLATLMALTIPGLRTPPRIAERLNLKREHVERVLTQLREMGLAETRGPEWVAKETTIHLPKDSQFTSLNHHHWRQKAVQDAFLQTNGIHYTSVCTLTEEDTGAIKRLVLDLIDKSRAIVGAAKEEEIYCLNCDWFKV